MGHPTTKPRPLEPEELIPVLQREHEEQGNRITQLKDSLAREDYARTAELLESLSGPLTQHVVDEETRMVKPLLDAYGREGASQAPQVIQQHRSKDKPDRMLSQLGATSPKQPSTLEKRAHDQAAEEVFPLALKTHRQTSRK